jgi:hypothetical protein
MNKETLDLLHQLAAKLGTTADHLWAILVRQAFVSGCTDLLFYMFTLAIVCATAKKTKRWTAAMKEADEEPVALFYAGTISASWVLSLVFIIVSVVSIQDTVAAFVNPEYWALKQILSAVSPKS